MKGLLYYILFMIVCGFIVCTLIKACDHSGYQYPERIGEGGRERAIEKMLDEAERYRGYK